MAPHKQPTCTQCHIRPAITQEPRSQFDPRLAWLCLVCKEWRGRSCEGKVRYPTPEEADAAMVRLIAACRARGDKTQFDIYRCSWCSSDEGGRGYHVGRTRDIKQRR